MIFKTYFGWTEYGRWYLSVFPQDRQMPKNQYDSKEAAEAEAAKRGAKIEWRS